MCNHLPNDDLIDSMVFCKHHCLLAMTEEQSMKQAVVWKEVSVFHTKYNSNITIGLVFSLSIR